ncbi:MAG: hypothetical protein N2317_06135 [Syntrophales bacterium]|nr:hypothetical protein [Syntrophales bacterium]
MNFNVKPPELLRSQGAFMGGVQSEMILREIFRPGAVFEAYVLKKNGDAVVLQIGNRNLLTVRTETHVEAGSSLLLRVKNVFPRIELEILSTKESDSGIKYYLLLHRSNPQRFTHSLMEFFKCIDALRDVSPYTREVVTKHVERVNHFLKRILFSFVRGGEGSPDISGYVKHMGLIFESGLLKTLHDNRSDSKIRERAGLKGAYLELLQVLRNLMESTDDCLERMFIEQFCKKVQEAVESIETLQILNVVAEQYGDPYYFPIPVMIPGGILQQDLYIERWIQSESTNERTYHFVMLLNPDMLGEIFVEVWIKGKSMDCHICCCEKSTHFEISEQLPKLKDLLIDAGFIVNYFTCTYEADFKRMITDYRSRLFVNNLETLSVFA